MVSYWSLAHWAVLHFLDRHPLVDAACMEMVVPAAESDSTATTRNEGTELAVLLCNSKMLVFGEYLDRQVVEMVMTDLTLRICYLTNFLNVSLLLSYVRKAILELAHDQLGVNSFLFLVRVDYLPQQFDHFD